MKMYRPHRLCPRNSKPKEPSLYRSLCVSILCMFLSTVMLVGTTFAWFHSSATSAVSTITAGSLNVSTSLITQDSVASLNWVPFGGNGVNPFSSIPLNYNSSQVIFLKIENEGSSEAVYRFALNLLDDTSKNDVLSSLLRYGYQILSSSDLLNTFSIPCTGSSENSECKLDGTTNTDNSYGSSGENTELSVTGDGFYVDALSAHKGTDVIETENNVTKVVSTSFGGNVCTIKVGVGETKYVAVALYMPDGSSAIPVGNVYVQLSMAVGQLDLANNLKPNVVNYEVPFTASLASAPVPSVEEKAEEKAE
ncbi:MAG TPA: hypothetical protein DER17_05355, partial [Oscillibacter sp.]|nr:hypothetical protein [Oscillibacter sp.]